MMKRERLARTSDASMSESLRFHDFFTFVVFSFSLGSYLLLRTAIIYDVPVIDLAYDYELCPDAKDRL